MLYLLFFFTALLLSMVISPGVISFSRECGLLDHPDTRKNHEVPMPLAGGLILAPFVFIGILISFPFTGNLPYVLAGTSLILGLGIWDDRFGTHFSTKFLIQIVAALLVMQSGLLFDLNKISLFAGMGVNFGPILSTIVTLLWIVGITNAVNIIDGMDGLAAGLCLNGFAGMGALALVSGRSGLAVFCLIMTGSLLGFLRYNIHPARTFLGDSGSMLLGFTLAVISIFQSSKTTTFLILVVPALLLALPMLDTVFAFARRGLRGQNPFRADRDHLHHRLLELNFTQKQTLGVFFSLSAGFGLLALWLAQTRQVHLLALAVSTLIFTLVAVKTMQVYNFRDAIQNMNSRMRAFAKRAVEKDPPGEERLMKNFAVLTGLCTLNFILALWGPQKSPVIAVAAMGTFAVGLVDVLLSRSEAEARFEILHVVLFLSLVVNQVAVLALWHRDYLVAPHFAVSAFLVLALLALFIYRTGTFAVFLQDPMEILALYIGIILCGIVKHYLGVSTMVPLAVALANALVLYILLKVYLSGYRLRSRTYSIGFAACIVILVSVPWWK